MKNLLKKGMTAFFLIASALQPVLLFDLAVIGVYFAATLISGKFSIKPSEQPILGFFLATALFPPLIALPFALIGIVYIFLRKD